MSPGAALTATAEVVPRYLTKSRFKLAMECATKLFYTGKPEFQNNALDNSFLQALAEGGFQVGALACLMYPGGIEITDASHAAQLATTRELLRRPEVTIYEAAFEANGLFVRADILRKRGNKVELVEVKAKSYDSTENSDFRGARGQLSRGMLPYLRDIAFQRYVAQAAFPQFEFSCFLMLADKSAKSSVDGLNQCFRIKRAGPRTRVEIEPGTGGRLGAPLLHAVPVDAQVNEILGGELTISGRPMRFPEAVAQLAEAYRADQRILAQPSSNCASCEFKSSAFPQAGQLRSGFHECWTEAFDWRPADFAGGTVLGLWNARSKQKLLESGVRKLNEVTPEHLGLAEGTTVGPQGMTKEQRQWFQCSGQWPGGGEQYVNAVGLRAAMRTWRFPLHFIDFETSAVAIPFRKGQRPYQTVAFQFSHHLMHADGVVEHRTQFLEARPGVDPTVPFLRALHVALGGDDGTVFRWATHENTVLRQLHARLAEDSDPPEDAAELLEFVDSITRRKTGDCEIAGPRAMVDLCELAALHHFHPSTQGSASLKKALPALMQGSSKLQSIYSRAVYGKGAEISSLNFQKPIAWWVHQQGRIVDPYELLPNVFSEQHAAGVPSTDEGFTELRAGGAAMAAYARLQFEDIDPETRNSIENALLRYCELDTLAMVMAVQAWQAWVEEAETSQKQP